MAAKVEETKKHFEKSKESLMKIRSVEMEISSQLEDDVKAYRTKPRCIYAIG